jgi:hypothetical protein
MNLKKITETDLTGNNFLENYSDFINFDEITKTLELENLDIHSNDRNGQLLSRIWSAFSPNTEIEIIILKNVKFSAGNLNLNIGKRLIIDSCETIGHKNFSLYPEEIEIINCNIYEFSFDLNARSLIITNSNVGKINIYPYANDGPRIKSINIQGQSRIKQITGLHWLLENNSSTVIIFSQDSKILNSAEESYRIMRLISNKFGDVVQSHIFHTNSLELYTAHSDSDTKTLLFFERWTNNFGRSIFLPVFWMLVINLLSISILIGFSDKFHVNGIWNLIGSIVNISPLSSYVSEVFENTSWEFSLDSIRRIFLAILTYQVIVSARRFSFVKK